MRPYVPPISQQPKPIAETLRSVRPNCRYSMAFPLFRRDRGRRPPKALLHGVARFDRRAVGDRHISPAHDLTGGNVALQRHVMGQADRQRALGKAALGWDQFAPNRVAAFAVERLAGPKAPLGDGDDIAAPALRLTGRLAAQRRRQYRNTKLQPYQMVGLVHCGVPAGTSVLR